MADGSNPRVVIGANNPPPSPFEACKAHMDDLLTEARNWADGAAVENQAQADEISRLIEDLRLGAGAADDARLEEKKPFDQIIDEIQAKYNAYIGGLKSKVKNPGKVVVAIDALKATLKPYLDKLDAEKRAREAEARRIAEEAAAKAAEAMRAAEATDLVAREEAEELVNAAKRAEAEANRAANDKAHASGGARAMGLRRTYTAVMTDRKAALVHYITTRPDDVTAYLQGLADADVRQGKRQLPGFDVVEGTAL